MATPERAIILSNLRLGSMPLRSEVRDMLSRLGEAPQTELILLGRSFDLRDRSFVDLASQGTGAPAGDGAAQEGAEIAALRAALKEVAQAAQKHVLTVLPGPAASDAGAASLHDPAQRRGLEKLLGKEEGQIQYAQELAAGVSGKALAAGDNVIWITTAEELGSPAGGLPEELLSSGSLLGFVRAWSRQLQLRRDLPEPEGALHHCAQILARALVEVASDKEHKGKEDRLLADLGQHLTLRGAASGDANNPPQATLAILDKAAELLGDVTLKRVRQQIDAAAAAVVVNAAPARYADDEAPFVVFAGDAGNERPSWVELALAGPLTVHIHGGATRPTPQPPAPSATPTPQEAGPGAPAGQSPAAASDIAAPQQVNAIAEPGESAAIGTAPAESQQPAASATSVQSAAAQTSTAPAAAPGPVAETSTAEAAAQANAQANAQRDSAKKDAKSGKKAPRPASETPSPTEEVKVSPEVKDAKDSTSVR